MGRRAAAAAAVAAAATEGPTANGKKRRRAHSAASSEEDTAAAKAAEPPAAAAARGRPQQRQQEQQQREQQQQQQQQKQGKHEKARKRQCVSADEQAVEKEQQQQKQKQQQQKQQQQKRQQQQQQQQKQQQEEEEGPTADPASSSPTAAAPAAAAETAGESEAGGTEAAVAATAAADPYLMEEADYLRSEKRWLNRQRVLTKWEKKEKLQDLTELCQLRSCNNVLYLEQRKNDALLHISKVPLGPTFIARLMNVETLRELRLTGNCLLHSRPLLLFSPEFEKVVYLRLLKELFVQVFGTPRNHPKSKPFFDHIAPLVVGEGGDADNPHRQTYIEIGPRFVMDPVKILEGSFCGRTLFRNAEYIATRDLLRPRRLQEALTFARRQHQKEKRRCCLRFVAELLQSLSEAEPKSKLATERIFGEDEMPIAPASKRAKKKRKV
ncbi:hypothetical protein Efla_006640 [Eimeria flavescens]